MGTYSLVQVDGVFARDDVRDGGAAAGFAGAAGGGFRVFWHCWWRGRGLVDDGVLGNEDGDDRYVLLDVSAPVCVGLWISSSVVLVDFEEFGFRWPRLAVGF